MATLTKRAVILIVCRFTSYGVQFLSPIFLVRIFDVHAYGQYREFILYAMLFSVFIAFYIPTNLIYFISKRPERERQAVTNSVLFLLITSFVGIMAVYLGRDLIRARTSFDFILPLLLYLFFYVNLDIYESYYLGKRETLPVLYYSTARIAARLIGVVVAAYVTRDVMAVIWVMIAVEFVRCVVLVFIFRKLFTRHLDSALIREQLRFIVPLGSSGAISYFNTELAKLVISVKMGVESLALYTVGSYQVPIISIVRSSTIDVIFPEMTRSNDRDRLRLWQRANVAFCFMIFPVFVVFQYYGHVVIETLFTSQYLKAVVLFRIYLALMILQCFEMGTPLRTINQNKPFVIASIVSLAVDIGCILLLFGFIGFVIPAIALVLGEGVILIYLGTRVLGLYRITLGELFMWKKVGVIALACLGAIPILFLGELPALNAVARAVIFSCAYGAAYIFLVRRFRVEEVDLMVSKVVGAIQRVFSHGQTN